MDSENKEQPTDPGPPPPPAPAVQPDGATAIINREFLQLGVLVAIAIVAFFFTRIIASNNQSTTRRDAASWYARGQQDMVHGRVIEAVPEFRRAMLNDRGDRLYALALARGLAQTRDSSGARNVLTALRQSAPEDPDVNVELARLSATTDSPQAAVRYYQNALYAPWPAGAESRRRAVRLEMIRLLLDQGDSARAVPELLGYAAGMSNNVADHVEMGRLFERAGENRRSLQQFESAVALEPGDTAALAGAALTAFELANYARSERYLRRLPAGISGLQPIRDVVGWIMAGDPLAGRIGLVNRAKRLSDALMYEQQRLDSCLLQPAGPAENAGIEEIPLRVTTLRNLLKTRSAVKEGDIDAGVDLLKLAALAVQQRCGDTTAREHSFILISQMHQGDNR